MKNKVVKMKVKMKAQKKYQPKKNLIIYIMFGEIEYKLLIEKYMTKDGILKTNSRIHG